MPALEERIRRLEDLEEIRTLTARYAFHINKGWNGKSVHVDAMSSIFTEDARWESLAMKLTVVGLENIMTSLQEKTEHTDFSMHSYTNPILEVDGDAATGNWLFWIASRRNGGPPNEVFMSEDISYRRTVDGWRIAAVNVHYGMMLNEQSAPARAS
ncbi:nuclear transport factor 2 family protein [Komagataeibacter sp. FNDCF1]|uniref:nuclear transport factor 2 family protein n=1 Tax=Komagataeibacter sp. FNDCF1 TaxID=2878681 RepID=UPI001E305442|nr:nuclear transport factor 2 family protein [Komagataeibacter sp. FNDCF1]MCE2564817.1 nuclear transport factor 2 family protein [Komagataeibacter sp. FNDCF1]